MQTEKTKQNVIKTPLQSRIEEISDVELLLLMLPERPTTVVVEVVQ